jgi:DNA-binding GntR family transcriptional regulator
MAGKPSLSTHIFATLKERIIRWAYPPGFRLTEEELCQEFGVSRAPVREALRMLAENGLVDKTPHRGCTVKLPDLTEVHDLYDLRLALELFVVAELAEHGMDEATWRQLYTTWQALLAHPPQPALADGQLAHEDAAFHEALAQATGNRLLFDQLRQIDERLYFTRRSDITNEERLRITCQQHLQILDAIRARDVTVAQRALRTNVQYGRDNVAQSLKEALAQAYLGMVRESASETT